MNKISIIHTPCKSCKFADYQDNIQTSCLLGKIDLYKKRNVEVLEVYDEEKSFFVINNKKCPSFRTEQWYTKKNIGSIEEAKALVYKENELKYIALIYSEPDMTIDNFKTIIDSLVSQEIRPKGVMVIREKNQKYLTSIKEMSLILNETKIPWRLQKFIDEDMNFDQKIRASIRSAPMDRFYFLIYPSKYIYCDFIKKINKYIEDGNSFGCINLNDNLFFSYLTLTYIKNLKDIDLLYQTDIHTKYETID